MQDKLNIIFNGSLYLLATKKGKSVLNNYSWVMISSLKSQMYYYEAFLKVFKN